MTRRLPRRAPRKWAEPQRRSSPRERRIVGAAWTFLLVLVPALPVRAALLTPFGPPALPERSGLPPELGPVADALGFVLYRKGVLDRAERLLAEAAGQAPKNPEIRYHLGLVYVKQGKAIEARQEPQAALAAGPFPGAGEASQLLEGLR